MTRYRMDDGSVVDTDRATAQWADAQDYDGCIYVSRATRSQWHHQQLYRSRKGRYYVEHSSQWQGSRAHVEWVSREEAARWLISHDHALPEDLADLTAEVIE